MNVYIGEPIVVSDMQGPAPDGFHVPLQTEWQAIYDAYTGLGLSGGIHFATYLKIPSAGYRNYKLDTFESRGSGGLYWSSSPYNTNNAYNLYFNTSDVYTKYNFNRSCGFPVRCVDNFPVIPTDSWTKLYGTSIERGGIFHNVIDGIISISSDGVTWYTLMDKNLGATTVYNYGDVLTEANCGKVYQRGNNYAFSGDVDYDVSQISQSSTQVNVTRYGPGNYYNSSIWITRITRQSSDNDGNNLRGGVSQGSTTKSVELKNAYIGEYGWKPGSNTIAYFPFSEDTNDHSGNGVILTNTQYLSKQALGYLWSINDTRQMNICRFSNMNAKFISIWYNISSASGNTGILTLSKYGGVGYNPSHNESRLNNKIANFVDADFNMGNSINGMSFNARHHLTIGYDGSNILVSKDGVQEMLYNGTGYNFGDNVVVIQTNGGTYQPASMQAVISECIIESVCWTAQEVADYYNNTKSNYGL